MFAIFLIIRSWGRLHFSIPLIHSSLSFLFSLALIKLNFNFLIVKMVYALTQLESDKIYDNLTLLNMSLIFLAQFVHLCVIWSCNFMSYHMPPKQWLFYLFSQRSLTNIKKNKKNKDK